MLYRLHRYCDVMWQRMVCSQSRSTSVLWFFVVWFLAFFGQFVMVEHWSPCQRKIKKDVMCLSNFPRSDVNHMFILNVDPRCRVTPEWFFARAATLTTLWILIFGTLASTVFKGQSCKDAGKDPYQNFCLNGNCRWLVINLCNEL